MMLSFSKSAKPYENINWVRQDKCSNKYKSIYLFNTLKITNWHPTKIDPSQLIFSSLPDSTELEFRGWNDQNDQLIWSVKYANVRPIGGSS